MLRLFLSHNPAQQRAYAHDLKEQLLKFGIDAFVAHDDIPANAQWHAELVSNLNGMDALLFLSDQAGNASAWCNQEIGFAFALGKTIVALMLGVPPGGLILGQQGIRSHASASQDAKAIYDVLVKEPLLRSKIAIGLAERLSASTSFDQSNTLAATISQHPAFPQAAIDLMVDAQAKNVDVREAFKVPAAIENAKKKVV